MDGRRLESQSQLLLQGREYRGCGAGIGRLRGERLPQKREFERIQSVEAGVILNGLADTPCSQRGHKPADVHAARVGRVAGANRPAALRHQQLFGFPGDAASWTGGVSSFLPERGRWPCRVGWAIKRRSPQLGTKSA